MPDRPGQSGCKAALARAEAEIAPLRATVTEQAVALHLADRLLEQAGWLAELRGWSPRTLSLTQRGLRILMDIHGPGEPVRASTVRQLTARNMPFLHIAAVLADAGVLEDDRALLDDQSLIAAGSGCLRDLAARLARNA